MRDCRDVFALCHWRQIFFRLFTGDFAAINFQPSGRDQNFSFRLERLSFDTRDPSRVLVLRRWKEYGHKTLRHHIEDLALVLIE